MEIIYDSVDHFLYICKPCQIISYQNLNNNEMVNQINRRMKCKHIPSLNTVMGKKVDLDSNENFKGNMLTTFKKYM